MTTTNTDHLAEDIKRWGRELGFQQVGISDIELEQHEQHLQQWLQDGLHGNMDYMHKHGSKRSHPEQLVPGTVRVISVRMDYWPEQASDAQEILDNPIQAYISRYGIVNLSPDQAD